MRPETEYRGAADIAQSQPDSLSQKDGRAAHNTDTCMQTGRYMRRQKYTLSKTPQNPLSYRPIRSTEKSFPVIIHQAEQLELFQLELFQIPDSFSGAPISVAKHHASEGGTQA